MDSMGFSFLFSSNGSMYSDSSYDVDFILILALVGFAVSVRMEIVRLIMRIKTRKASKRGTPSYQFSVSHLSP